MAKYVYFFGGKKAEGDSGMKNLLGGKGANLAEMVNLGIPVPPGFTITTEVCTTFYEKQMQLPEGLKEEVLADLKKVEELMGMRFGDPKNPLLLSIRSGARASMPGMMDTVLNLGLNATTVKALAELRATNGSPGTATAASSPCTATWSSASSRRARKKRTPSR